MPGTKLMFYVPDIGAVVSREFKLDETTGLVYSNYAFKTQSGEIYRYSDHNMTNAKWNADVLPNLLDNANLLEGTECRMFDNQEGLINYLRYHNHVKPQSEIEIEKAIKEGDEVFSSAENKYEIEHAISEKMKGLASARIMNDNIRIEVEPHILTRQGGKLSLRLDNGETFLFSSIKNEGISGGKAVFEIEKDQQVLYMKDSREKSGIPDVSTITAEECRQLITNAMNSTNVSVKTQKNSR
jgi:hypothetical protein